MKKAAIPEVRTGNQELDRALQAVKQNLDDITGQHKNAVKLKPLATTATTAEIVAQLNAMLERMQG